MFLRTTYAAGKIVDVGNARVLESPYTLASKHIQNISASSEKYPIYSEDVTIRNAIIFIIMAVGELEYIFPGILIEKL